MSSEQISRAFAADLEIRADGTGRTIHGIVVPFGKIAKVRDGWGPAYEEAFEMGAFKRTILHKGDRVKLLSQHDAHRNPLGRAQLLREDAAGLYGEFGVSKTQAGDEAIELVRDGALDSFSVGFTPMAHEKRGKVTWRTEVGLREASLVTFPAYEDALVGGVRQIADLTDEEVAALSERLLANIPDLRRLLEISEQDTADEAPVPPVESDSADATRLDVTRQFLTLRRKAREMGVL